MTLILFFTIIYLANTSDALVCYQCSGASMVSNAFIKNFLDGLMQAMVDRKRIDSPKIFCNNIDDLGEEKTCDSGSYCYTEELQLMDSKEKYVVRSCVKQDQEDPDIMECTETDNGIFTSKQKECRCSTNRCNGNGNGNGNGNSNGNGNGNGTGNGNANSNGKALTCYECDKTMKEALDHLNPELSQNKQESPSIGHFCEDPNDVGKLKTCKEGEVCSKQIFEQSEVKIYARFCDPNPVDLLMGKCHFIDQEGGLRVCLNMLV